MTVLGYNTVPTFGFFSKGASTDNQIGALYTMPSPGGTVTGLHAYAQTFSGSAKSGFLVMWDGSGNVLASVAVTIPGSAAFVGGTLGTAVFVASGQQVFIGWAVPASDGFVANFDSVGGASLDYNESASIPGSIVSHTNVTGEQIGTYADYTILAAPNVTGATPNPSTFGGSVAVTGTGFLHATSMTIGGAAASFVINSDISITATVPAGATPGLGTLVVTNAAGSDSIAFTVGGIAYINTGTSASPVWTKGVVSVNTGTPASPVWTTANRMAVWSGTAWIDVS